MSLAEIWSLDFMRYALLSACILGPTCALLGVCVTLRGLAFFSDALAHAAITGVALGFLLQERLGLDWDPMFVVLVFSSALALGMTWLLRHTGLKGDTVVAVSFTGSVALGIVLISWLQKYRLLDGILFGSIYANSPQSLLRQCLLALAVLAFLLLGLRSFTLATLNRDLAAARGRHSPLLDYGFALLLAATVVVSLKMLGALLLSALIVIPATAARPLSQSLRGLLGLSALIGLAAPVGGVWLSCKANLPTGPCMVLALLAVLCGCLCLGQIRKRPPIYS